MLEAQNLSLSYPGGLQALHDVTLSIEAGQFVSILGPSGCGKSTLLRIFSGLLAPTSGTISISGSTPQTARLAGTQMSFVFQDATLLPWRTVAENVCLPLELLNTSRGARQQIVDDAVNLVGLKEFARHFPAELSGGMRMRVSLARALATRPQLLFMDEPFGALDDITRGQLNEELLRLWSESGWTGVFVTHNIAEAIFLSQRVLIIGPRPGTVTSDFTVPFPYPRSASLRATPEFASLTGKVSESLFAACQDALP